METIKIKALFLCDKLRLNFHLLIPPSFPSFFMEINYRPPYNRPVYKASSPTILHFMLLFGLAIMRVFEYKGK